jgi:hypothetical protein
MSREMLGLAASLLVISTIAAAAPKPPANGTFTPEIGYTYASGSTMDLRLANRAGYKAILVHRTGYGKLRSFDLSDSASRRIAYTDGEKLYLRRWEIDNGAIKVLPAQLIYDGLVDRMDFKQDGSRLAFTTIGEAAPASIFTFSPGEEGAQPVPILTGWQVLGLRWDPTDQGYLYFWGGPFGASTRSLHRIPEAGGTPERISMELSGAEFDVIRTGLSPSGVFMAVSAGSEAVFYNTLDSTAFNYPAFTLKSTSHVHFNCKNDHIIARDLRARRQAVAITKIYPKSTPVIWSSDANIHHTDWIAQVPCE